MPRVRQPRLPAQDALVDYRTAARLLKIHPTDWSAYWRRWPALVKGLRIVRTKADPGTRGGRRWLYSSLIYHMHVELARGQRAVQAEAATGAAR